MEKRPNVGATVTLDGEKEFKAALSEINAGLKVNASQMQLVTATYQNGGKSIRDLTAAHQVLEDQIASQTDKVQLLERALQSSAQKNGESSKKTMEWQASLNKAKAELARMETALKDNEESLAKVATATGDLSDELEKTEDAGKKAKSGTDIFNVSLGNLIADGIKKTISAMGDLLEKTAEYRSDMSKLEQNTKDAGASLEVVQDGMRRLNAITGETDSNIEAVSNLLAAGFTDNNLVTAIDTLSGAVIKFPDTIKIESLADSLQETLATKEATGQFAEALDRLGVNVEAYNKRISKMGDEQARNYTITLLQRKGLDDVTESWRQNNREMVEAANAAYDLEKTQADLAETLDPIRTQILGQINELLVDNKDVIQDVIQVVGSIIGFILRTVDALADVPAPVLLIAAGIGAVTGALIPMTAATKIASTAMATATAKMAASAPAAASAGAGFALLAVEITAVAAAIALVIAAIAKLVDAIRGVPSIGINSNLTEKPQMTSSASIPRYARGTSYHPGGLATINDGGGYPGETVLLPRGSRVYPASQGGGGDTYNYYVTVDAKNIREFNDIVRIAENERQSKRQGYVRQF